MDARGMVLKKGAITVLGALTVAAGSTALAGVAHGTTLFTGAYHAVVSSPGQPDRVSIWNVSSSCAFLSCVAHVAQSTAASDWLFDGNQWNRLAVPQFGDCNGVTVPARSARQTLVPQADGSLAGSLTSSVDCNGTTVEESESLTVTPWVR
jgi:hypothetical protein